MLFAETTWNQLGLPSMGTHQRTLCIHPVIEAPEDDLGCAVLVLLDASETMKGARLQAACDAVLALFASLRPDDRLGILAFNYQSHEVLPWTKRKSTDHQTLKNLLGATVAQYNTRLDLGLQASAQALGAPELSSLSRHLFVLTDGVPTDAKGHALADRHPLLEQVADLSKVATISTIGFGRAADYDAPFLAAVADRGMGEFYPARSAEILCCALRASFESAQSKQLLEGKLLIETSHSIVGAARILPSCCPLEPQPLGEGQWSLSVGALGPGVEFLVEFEIDTFQEPLGPFDVGQLRMSARSGASQVSSPSIPLIAKVCDPGSELAQIDERVDKLRLAQMRAKLERQRGQAQRPAQQARVTRQLLQTAQELKDDALEQRYERELAQLKQDQALSAEALAQADLDARQTRWLPGLVKKSGPYTKQLHELFGRVDRALGPVDE